MTTKTINDIDFGKLTLPEWCDFNLHIKLDMGRPTIMSDGRHSDPRVAFLALDGWAASPGTDGHLLTELDQLRAICAQVDAFIETELAKLNAPEWVKVPWGDAEELRNAGATVEYVQADCVAFWVASAPGYWPAKPSLFKFRADRSTLPAGYVLGVGFAEAKAEPVKAKTIRERVEKRPAYTLETKVDNLLRARAGG